MNRHEQFSEIEERLRHEADRVASSCDVPPPPVTTLIGECRQRLRKRRMAWAACCVSGLLLLSASLYVFRPAAPSADHKSLTRVSGSPGKNDRTRVALPNENHTPDPESSPSTDGELVAWFVDQPDSDATGPSSVLVFFTQPDGDRHEVIATGVYVPEHTEHVNLLDLTRPEQRAVREVLGMTGQDEWDETI